jgi:lysozyme
MIYNDTWLIQSALKDRGFDPGEIDGKPGKNTTAAKNAWLASVNAASAASAPTATAARPVNSRGIELIKHFESCLKPLGGGRFAAYPDPAHGWKVPTIGWGTIQYPNGETVRQGDIITQAQADEYLAWEMAEKGAAVARLVQVAINDDQFAALVSFAYNCGIGNLKSSTLLKRLNAGDAAAAADQFQLWNKAGGKVLAGLTRRRLSERNLFLGKTPYILQS